MSGRGRGRGGGGPAGGERSGGRSRGQQSPSVGRGSGGRRGSSSGYNAPPRTAVAAAPVPPPPSSEASAISRELQQKMSLQASASGSGVSGEKVGEQGVVEERRVPPASSKAIRPPARPGFGTIGRRCLVRANHFLVEVADRDLHLYDVAISPEVSSKKVCRGIMSELVKSYKQSDLGDRQLAYDGNKIVYAAGPLPFSSKEFVINLSDKDDGAKRERVFKVLIKFAAKVDLHHLKQFLRGIQPDVPQETIQALDVALREKPSNDYVVVGRSFFHPTFGRGELGDGIEYWKGYYQSLRPTQMGLSLNIDVSATAFYEPIPVIDFITKYLNITNLRGSLSEQERIKVKKALRGIRVQHNCLGYVRRYKISDITDKPISKLTFSLDGIDMPVVQYFHQKYKATLAFTLLPALQSGSAYLPMEVCTIVEGQKYSKRLNEKQVTALLRATCERPNIRENRIKDMVRHNNYDINRLLHQEFGIQVKSEFTSIEARVLPPPMLKYHETGGEPHVDPRVGQWNMINKKMVNGGMVNSWTCVSFARNFDVFRFCEELIDMCSSKGMVFNPQPLLPIQSANPSQIEKTLVDIHSKSIARLRSMNNAGNHLQLLIIVLPDATGQYSKIKRVCETELGIVSQCCQPRQAKKLNKQYLENVALKINVKVGGRNAVLDQAVKKQIPFLTDRPTIIFGADVTHPQPGEDSSPSIAAVVASMDWPEATKYRGLVSAQPHRKEIIQELYTYDQVKGHGGLIRELLIAFLRSTKYKPERIIFYRDGVSEGQFNQVLLEEVDAIRKACSSLQEGYQPRVTFVVVQKRHHTRLFPANHGDRNSTDRSGNILPGTVVETKICHPTEFDFYLCSHAGIQGTSRPTHYHVLYDENGFTADAMQMLTNNLCYTYARCTRSVSIVPPAYYAHLAAFRARYYIEGEYSDSGSARSGRATREQNVEVRQLPAIKDNVKDVMFYC